MNTCLHDLCCCRKKFTGRWYFDKDGNNRMPESTTTSELSSYAMEKNYEGGLTSVGEGKLNWRGNPICGSGGAGINCYNTRSGSPNQNPNGGHGMLIVTTIVFVCTDTALV
jgi:hypothetical protein